MGSHQIIYDELNELHRGGFAKLTVALREDGSKVVVRELLPAYVFRWRTRRNFIRGTKIREQLSDSPTIVRSLEYGVRKLRPYEIIEHIDGVSLRRLMQQREPCLKDNCVEILRQAALALSHVHSRGFIHLDVKPENFVVDSREPTPTVKLTDFDLTVYATECHPRVQSGTLAYLAPEQIRKEPFGPAVDIFAFGILAYQLVTGRMPFVAKSKKKLIWAQTSEAYRIKPPLEVNPDLTPKLDRVIMQCLEKNPANRLPSMAYLCQELSHY